MATNAIEGLEEVAIIGGLAFLAYVLYNAFSSPAGQAIGQLASGLIQIPATALNTLVASGDAAGTPGTDSNLFYAGVNNLLSTGSIYGDQGGTDIPATPAGTGIITAIPGGPAQQRGVTFQPGLSF